MTRKTGKKLALWLSANATTAPVVGGLVATLVDVSIDGEAPEVDVGAAGDVWQEFIVGIPGATFSFNGRMDVDDPQALDEFKAGDEHRCFLLPDSSVTADYFDFNIFFTKWSVSAARDGAWDLTAAGRVVSAPTFTNG